MEKSNISLFKNKKGNLWDYITVAEVLIVALVFSFVAYIMLTNFSSGIDAANVTSTNYTSFIESSRDRLVTSTDWGVLVFLVAALIFSIIMAIEMPTEPKYIAIILIISFVFFIVAFIISNVFGGLMDNSVINSFVLTSMPITNILLRYFPFVTAIYIGAVLIAFFGKDEI